MKKFFIVLMVLREAQNHKNNKFPFSIRKVNPNFELLDSYSDSKYGEDNMLLYFFVRSTKKNTTTSFLFISERLIHI